ncbi:hypothetical protein LIER_15888 [Lithospermum erythrorhizon]|uniref:Uncharacterized protein n=1 Tax=Lithospermum erythrorhizon TaxID=34254 RepID=A0AAV3Q732_LITER
MYCPGQPSTRDDAAGSHVQDQHVASQSHTFASLCVGVSEIVIPTLFPGIGATFTPANLHRQPTQHYHTKVVVIFDLKPSCSNTIRADDLMIFSDPLKDYFDSFIAHHKHLQFQNNIDEEE